ncbi:unnamed protein product [Closterium sp. NIES-64]|nr:unnamed protein product [Closterium sp. NIES-64]
MNIPFDIVPTKGPIIHDPIRTAADVAKVQPLDPDTALHYVGETLQILRKEAANQSTVLGFVGAPFTMASYIVEGGSSKNFSIIKRMAFSTPEILHALLAKLAESTVRYMRYQADNGAQAIQIFDSWATSLSPCDFEVFSLPYIKQIVAEVKSTHPDLPIILYASGSGGLLERMSKTGVDVVSVDWTVDMAEARERIGKDIGVQGNVDPAILFGSKETITARIHETVAKAGSHKHILNLGHATPTMGAVPPGLALIQYLHRRRSSRHYTTATFTSAPFTFYGQQTSVLVLTFLAYALFHATRKPPSIVKAVLNPLPAAPLASPEFPAEIPAANPPPSSTQGLPRSPPPNAAHSPPPPPPGRKTIEVGAGGRVYGVYRPDTTDSGLHGSIAENSAPKGYADWERRQQAYSEDEVRRSGDEEVEGGRRLEEVGDGRRGMERRKLKRSPPPKLRPPPNQRQQQQHQQQQKDVSTYDDDSAGLLEELETAAGSIANMRSRARGSSSGGEGGDRAVGFLEAWRIPGVAAFALCLFFAKLVAYTFLYWLPFFISRTEPVAAAAARGGGDRAVGFLEAWRIPGVAAFALCLFFAKLVAYTFLYWLPFFISCTAGGIHVSILAAILHQLHRWVGVRAYREGEAFALCLFFVKLVAYTFLYWLPFFISRTGERQAPTMQGKGRGGSLAWRRLLYCLPSFISCTGKSGSAVYTKIEGRYLSDAQSGIMSTVFDVGGVVGGILAGHLADQTAARATVSASFLLLAAPALAAYFLLGGLSLWVNILLLSLSGVLVNGPYALITCAVSADLGQHKSLQGNARALATVTAIIDGTGSVGAALGPFITGFISQLGGGGGGIGGGGLSGWGAVFVMLGVSLVAAVLCIGGLVVEEVRGVVEGRRGAAAGRQSLEQAALERRPLRLEEGTKYL